MTHSDPAPLCALDDIPDGGSIGLKATLGGTAKALMAIRKDNAVWVYVNACPHVGAPLDFKKGRFLTPDGSHILCANHGALFTVETGECVHGPATGQTLDAVPVEIRDGKVFATDGE